MYLVLLFIAISFQYSCAEYSDFFPDDNTYSGAWIVRITKGLDVAKWIAKNEGFMDIDEIPEMKLYRFSNSILQDQDHKIIHARLSKYEEITWKKPEKIREDKHAQRQKLIIQDAYGNVRELDANDPEAIYIRSTFKTHEAQQNPELRGKPRVFCAGPENMVLKSSMPLPYNDPLYTQQWFMRSCKEINDQIPSYYDIGLNQTREIYKLYGEGVRIIVMDDAITVRHEDLAIDLDYSFNYITGQRDPSPVTADESHGTMCAGVIGMKQNNGICGVGIAPNASMGGLKVFDGSGVPDWIYAKAFQFRAAEVHVSSRSLGRAEDHSFDPIDEEVHTALQIGVTEGRRGKGVIYVFPAGNDKKDKHTCGTRSFENSIYSITIGGVNHDGTASKYAERCAAIMAVVYSGDSHPYTIPTLASASTRGCFEYFQGTSASTPMAAGLFALVVQANPKLTWREVQHAVAWTSEIAPLFKNPRWIENGAGFYVNLDFGFGLLNVYNMVEMAMNFQPIGPMNICSFDQNFGYNTSFDLTNPKRIKLPTKGCKGLPTEVNYIENVELTIAMRYPVRGDLQIDLTSPKKTTVNILERRPQDGSPFPINKYSWQSVHTWGEDPEGDWFVDFIDENGNGYKKAEIYYIAITLYGTKDQPYHYMNGKRKYVPFSKN